MDYIDHHEQKFDMLPATISVIKGLLYQKDMVVSINSIVNANNEDSIRMLKKLRETSNPVVSHLRI